MKLLTAAQSRELDRLSQEKYHIASYSLMTNAGEAVARAALEKYRARMPDGALIVAGKGNNGGDGFVTARKLHQDGVKVRVILLAQVSALKGDAARAHADFISAGGAVTEVENETALESAVHERPGIVVDGIFGTGLNAEVKGLPRATIERINALKVPVVAIDIASGINSDTGAVMAAAIDASLTVTFGLAKFGHLSYPGAAHCGELKIAEIGFAREALDEIAPRGLFVEAKDARGWITPRTDNSHKGMYGHVMVIAGSRGKAGASLLSSRGALRAGAGLVTAAIPNCVADIVSTGQAELMTEAIADRDGHFDGQAATGALASLIKPMSAIVVGPGIGVSDGTEDLIAWLISEAVQPDRPMLIDADGLNVLAKIGPEKLRNAKGPVVLTPHPGEMSRLLGIGTKEVNADRISAAKKLVGITGAVALLKGARSVIATASGDVYVNSTGNPGMGTPGMGDALSGMTGTFLAQRMDPLRALALAVYLHGYAADRVAMRYGRVGYIVGDLLDELPRAIDTLAY
jgi:ADP-dependent NAD(P)H-hydrate dehydratase / NAD(P)H-hydrate epimerase